MTKKNEKKPIQLISDLASQLHADIIVRLNLQGYNRTDCDTYILYYSNKPENKTKTSVKILTDHMFLKYMEYQNKNLFTVEREVRLDRGENIHSTSLLVSVN